MLYYAAVFFVIAIIAAVFGFGGIAAGAAGIAKILFVIFLVLFAVSLITGILRLTSTDRSNTFNPTSKESIMTATSLKISPRAEEALDGLSNKAGDLAHDMRTSKDQLVHDFKALAHEAEKLLSESASMGGSALEEAQHKLKAQLHEARQRLAELETITRDKAKQAARATDEYVHDHPWQSLAIVGGVGVVVGLLIGSRRPQ